MSKQYRPHYVFKRAPSRDLYLVDCAGKWSPDLADAMPIARPADAARLALQHGGTVTTVMGEGAGGLF